MFKNSYGKRQGYPLSALFFVQSVKMMALRIRNNKDIKGFQIKIDSTLWKKGGQPGKGGFRRRVPVIFYAMCLFIYFYLKTLDILIISYSKSHHFNGLNKKQGR
jgi:hypothetical protein